MPKIDVGYDLKNRREINRWTQQQAADNMGISRSYYAMVEIGYRIPSVKVARRIQKVFGIDWYVWFENTDTEQ